MIRLLQEYLDRGAGRRPEGVAVVMGNDHLTYGTLEASSNRLARMLRALGCERGDRVCLFLPKSVAAIECMVGVLKADCAYVPIDVAAPAARLEGIVRSVDPRAIIMTASTACRITELEACQALSPDVVIGSVDAEPTAGASFRPAFTRSDWTQLSGEPIQWANAPADAAHILFTSGSTGTPKGVVITHSNVIAFIEWACRYFAISASDRVSGHPPLFFDLSTFDIYGTLAAGAELHLVPPALSLLPHKLADFIRDRELSQWFSVPSILTYMAKQDAIRSTDFATLKRLLWCGEQMPTRTLIHWMTRVPHASFTNLYGPTEATIASTYHTVPSIPTNAMDEIPLGSACAGEEVLVLDETLAPTRPGEVGSLYIGGVGLSPGYWRDEQQSRAAFHTDHRPLRQGNRLYATGDLARVGADGSIYFVGRADSQVKSRGYRIELGEIEIALGGVTDVRECAIVGIPTDGFEGTVICCAYTPQPGAHVLPSRLRQELSQRLPSYMVPSQWMTVDRLPKNANGKTDRAAVRRLFEQRPSTIQASNERV